MRTRLSSYDGKWLLCPDHGLCWPNGGGECAKCQHEKFSVTTIREQVTEFHKAMNVPICEKPQLIPDERMRLRVSLIAEEFLELIDALYGDDGTLSEIRYGVDRITQYPVLRDEPECLVDTADALADLAYVIEGMNLELGINGEKVLEEVHKANMAKVGGPIRADGKRLKPEGWTPPDIEKVLRGQGWKP